MWVFNLLNLFLLQEVVIKVLCMFASHLVFISLCFLTSWFLNMLCIVFCFYLIKSARCNGRNVVLSFSLIKILLLLLFVKVLLASDSTRKTMNFKLSNISGNSVYIKIKKYSYKFVAKSLCFFNQCFISKAPT